jgi:YHS domain-containing protein
MCKACAVSLILAVGVCGLAGCGDGHEHETPAAKTLEKAAPLDPNAKPYPLKTCLVSGEELGKMGEPFRFTYKGQEIKLCCKGCEKDFNKEPEKYLQKIAAAAGK